MSMDGLTMSREDFAEDIEAAVAAATLATITRRGETITQEDHMVARLGARRIAQEMASFGYPQLSGYGAAEAMKLRARFIEAFGAAALAEIENPPPA